MNTFKIFVLVGSLIMSLADAHASVGNAVGAISLQGDTVHFELSGYQNWDYDVKRLDQKGKTVVEMTIPSLDEGTIKALTNFKSDMVTSIAVDKKGIDGKSIVSFTLLDESIDTFDYLTDQPSRLIIDFFASPQKQVVEVKAKESKKVADNGNAKVLKIQGNGKTEKIRKPATADILSIANSGLDWAQNEKGSTSGIFDGGDPEYSRFSVKDYEIKEGADIRAKENYYIPFPLMETTNEYWEKIKYSPTLFEVIPKETEENKQARLLLTLFEKKRFGVFLKTKEWFKEKYPVSEYSEIVDYMIADVYWELYKQEQNNHFYEEAVQKYKENLEKYPKSPLAEKTSLRLGFYALEHNDYPGALRQFKKHIENDNFGGNDVLSKDLAKIGSALAFAKMNIWDQAIGQLQGLEKTSTNPALRAEASYRRGDIWARSKNYKKAVEEYQNALKKYPDMQTHFPNAYYNQAEALFWLKDFNKSLEAYLNFVKKYPNNEHSAFAMTRMGELLEIFGVDRARPMGAFLETYFRFGENPATVIARLRLVSGRMKGMKPKELEHAVDEIMALSKKIELPNIEQFANVMIADGYSRREEYQKAVDLLSKYYKEHPSTVDIPLFSNLLISNINNKLKAEVDSGDFISALKTHKKYSDSWLKNSNRLDTKYYIGRSFEMGGVPDEAEKYYRDVINKTYSIRGTPEAKENEIKGQAISEDELNFRLASVFAQQKHYNQAYEYLKNVKIPEKLPEATQIERVNLAVSLLEKRGDTDSAIRYLGELLKTWKGQPELVAEPYLELSRLQLKQGNSVGALQSLGMIVSKQNDSQKVPGQVHAKALELIGDINLKNGKKEAAIDSYSSLLEKYEETRPLSSIRYKLGQIHFNNGSLQKAAEVWNGFKGEKSDFWKNLAQEQLKNSEWRDNYQKYIRRIPAMSENEQGK